MTDIDSFATNRRLFLQMAAASAALTACGPIKANSPKRIAVIGGGIVGASITYHLAREGAAVTLLERGDLATQASRGTLAWINASWAKQPRHYHRFTQLGVSGWRKLGADLGLPVRWGGSLEWFSSPERQERLAEQIAEQAEWGEPARMVSPDEFSELEPNFKFMGADQAAFSQNDGAVDPVLATRMLVDKAVSLGATLKTKCSVERARSTDAGNVVLETSCGDLEVDRYVLATGADPRAVETLCDMELPQRSTAGAIVLTKPMPRMINRLIAAPGAHLHQRNDGRIVLADQDGVPDTEAHAERLKNRPNRFPSREIAELHSGRILAPVAQYLPGIASAEVEDVFIGWRPLPIDGHPVLGTPNSRKEAYIAIMHSGVSLAPIVGEIVAREILGEHHAIELAPYRPDRNFEMIRRY